MIRRLWERFMGWLACPMTIAEWEALQESKERARAFERKFRKTADFSVVQGADKPEPEPPIMFLDV